MRRVVVTAVTLLGVVLAGLLACGGRVISRAPDAGALDASHVEPDPDAAAEADGDDAGQVAPAEDMLSAEDATCVERPPPTEPTCWLEEDELYGAETGDFHALDGSGTAIATHRNRAYVTFEDGRFAVLDIEDPAAPVMHGTVLLPAIGRDVEVGGRWVWVAVGSAGLAAVDVLDGNAPRIVARIDLGGDARALSATCSFAYVANGPEGLAVVDIRAPDAPQHVASVALDSEALASSVSSEVVLVGLQTGVAAVDATVPEAPYVRSALETNGAVRAVAWASSWAYLGLEGPTSGILPVDFTQLDVPVPGELVLGDPIVTLEVSATVLTSAAASDNYFSVATWCDPSAPRTYLGRGFGQCGPDCEPNTDQAVAFTLEAQRVVILHSELGLEFLRLSGF